MPRPNSRIVSLPGVSRRVAGVFALAAVAALAACGDSDSPSAAKKGGGSIVLALPFPCGLNDYATQTCDGAKAAAKELPDGYSFTIKNAIDYTDVQSFNNLLQTTLQLEPAGLIVFANGPAAQTPVLNQACDQGAKVIFYDTAGTGVKCRVSYVTPNHTQLGAQAAKWLIAHPPKNNSKEVAIVSQQLGQFPSNDARVKGFKDTIEAAGYRVVETVVSTNALDQTRTGVTNALTAHPDLAAIFSANSPLGQGTRQALKSNDEVVQLTTDGAMDDIPSLLDGTVSANVAQAPYVGGQTSIETMVKVLQGEKVPEVINEPYRVLDKTNAQEFLDAGGLR